MTRDKANAVLDRLRVRVISSDAHGITIQRSGITCGSPRRSTPAHDPGGHYSVEQWRVESSSGIAGTQAVTLVHMHTTRTTLGPFATMREFSLAVRAWRRWDLP